MKPEILTSELLREKGFISPVDVFIRLGCLDPKDHEAWRHGQVPHLEAVIKGSLRNSLHQAENKATGRTKCCWLFAVRGRGGSRQSTAVTRSDEYKETEQEISLRFIPQRPKQNSYQTIGGWKKILTIISTWYLFFGNTYYESSIPFLIFPSVTFCHESTGGGCQRKVPLWELPC